MILRRAKRNRRAKDGNCYPRESLEALRAMQADVDAIVANCLAFNSSVRPFVY